MDSPILLDLCPSFTMQTAFYPETSQGYCKSMYNAATAALRMACHRDAWYHLAVVSLPY